MLIALIHIYLVKFLVLSEFDVNVLLKRNYLIKNHIKVLNYIYCLILTLT